MRTSIFTRQTDHSFEVICAETGNVIQRVTPYLSFHIYDRDETESSFSYFPVPRNDKFGYALDLYYVSREEQALDLRDLMALIRTRKPVCYVKHGTKGLWALDIVSAMTGLIHIPRETDDELVLKLRDLRLSPKTIVSKTPLRLYEMGRSCDHVSIDHRWENTIETDGEIDVFEEGLQVAQTHPSIKHRGCKIKPDWVQVLNATYVIARNNGRIYFIWFDGEEAKKKVTSLI